jgi:hypothetical protein
MRLSTSALGLALFLLGTGGPALASPSAAFDRDCANYYRQELDPDVSPDKAEPFCACLADEFESAGLGTDALDFFARTYSDDLTTFIHEYPKGEAWMEQSFQAEPICKGEMGGTN